MGKPITNPYVAQYNKFFRQNGGPWVVSKRWMCKEKLSFAYVCHTKDEGTARHIARALNAYDKMEKTDEQKTTNNLGGGNSALVLGAKPPEQSSFGFL